jgi:crotonobetainyl-CoA:carnitine CoA-transferase CaiB-like acyl-CoA transferase
LWRDPQLVHRRHFVEFEHPNLGRVPVEGSAYRLSRTAARIQRSSPTLGGDNQYVLETILKYDAERIRKLVADGVLQ